MRTTPNPPNTKGPHMRSDDSDLRQLRNDLTGHGEVVSVTADSITIEGSFGHSIPMPLHPGARVFVVSEDEALGMMGA